MKTIKLFAIASALLVLFSACSKDKDGNKKDTPDSGVSISIVECNPFAQEIYVLYDATIPEEFKDCYMLAIAVSNPDAIKDVKNWKNLNSTMGGLFSSREQAVSGTNKVSIQCLTEDTDYMVVVALVTEGQDFIKISSPKYVKTTSPE